MTLCVEQRPEIRWRKQSAKVANWSSDKKVKGVVLGWADTDFLKPNIQLVHRFLQKSKRAYSSHVEQDFARLADEWKNDTMHWSSVTKMISHRNYLAIIGLAGRARRREVERLLLERLEREPDHWFDALSALTGEDPVKPEHDFDQAIEAWLEWGRQKGII